MRISDVKAMRLTVPAETEAARARREGLARRPGWYRQDSIDNPARKYAFARRDSTWTGQRPAAWETVACKVTAEDGTWGLGLTSYGRPVAAIIDDQFAPLLAGQPALATERAWDMMVRSAKAYGTMSLTSYAISAVDLALWDLKGKLLGQPVYALLGGPVQDELICYATGNDTDWYVELGFEANKLAHLWGLTERLEGLEATERQVAEARAILGPQRELMLDCWQSFDVDYTVRLAERLRPYRMRWIEECLPAEDLDAHVALRQRLPWMTLTVFAQRCSPCACMISGVLRASISISRITCSASGIAPFPLLLVNVTALALISGVTSTPAAHECSHFSRLACGSSDAGTLPAITSASAASCASASLVESTVTSSRGEIARTSAASFSGPTSLPVISTLIRSVALGVIGACGAAVAML